MKKALRIIEGLAINVGSMALGYLMVYLFYFLFIYQSKLVIPELS